MPRCVFFAVMTAIIVTIVSTAQGVATLTTDGTATYVFTTFDVPHAFQTVAEGINDRGQVVGTYTDEFFGSFHGFIYDDGVFTTIDFPGGLDTVLFGINNDGNTVGSYISNQQHGFTYDGESGGFTAVDAPFPGVFLTRSNGINNHGQIVGEYLDHPESNQQHGFLDDHGTFTTIDVPGANVSSATGVNDNGEIVGFYEDGNGIHGFLTQSGSFATIDVPLPGATSTTALGINNHGQIVGAYTDASGVHGYVYSEGVFNTIDMPGAFETVSLGINTQGQIVGFYSDGAIHGFVAAQIRELNTMVAFEPIRESFETSLDVTGCPPAFIGKFSFGAKLTNMSSSSLSSLVARVAVLTGDNLLQNADGGPAGVGSILMIPQKGGFLGLLSPYESVVVPLSICLKTRDPFELSMDVMGTEAAYSSDLLAQNN